MELYSIATTPDWHHPVDPDEALAARYATTTLMITAASALDVERLARRIHAAGPGASAPFVHTAAAALPVDATVLRQHCLDLVDAAMGGTLLLNNVEDMPAPVQRELISTLDGLQQTRERRATVRLIAGTTVSLRDRIGQGTFSESLFYRLNTIHVVVTRSAPPGETGPGIAG
jgi:DNA-binding NtrC family response regulator